MLERFRQYIDRRQLIALGDRILAGVSGGIDSMTLLDLLRQSCPGRIAAAHVHFGLRGAEADGDRQLVEAYCEEHAIPFHTVRFDTEAEAKARGESIQMAARRLRYEWFETLCDSHGYDRIAIAHHADDSAETFFINLLRGTGLRGLTGIADRRGRIIRPLLFARRDEVTAYAAAHGVPYREDSTNATLKYLRNRLRHDILPRLDSASNNRFARTMEENLVRLQATQQFIDLQIARLRDRAFAGPEEIDLDALDETCFGFELYELLRPFGFAPEAAEEIAALWQRAEEGIDALGKAVRGGKMDGAARPAEDSAGSARGRAVPRRVDRGGRPAGGVALAGGAAGESGDAARDGLPDGGCAEISAPPARLAGGRLVHPARDGGTEKGERLSDRRQGAGGGEGAAGGAALGRDDRLVSGPPNRRPLQGKTGRAPFRADHAVIPRGGSFIKKIAYRHPK